MPLRFKMASLVVLREEEKLMLQDEGEKAENE
jgi:hypothetical protein